MSSASDEESPTGNVEATKMIRPAATEEDKAIFNQLLQKISAADSYFCCGGTLELTDRPLTLYYKSKTTSKNNWLDFSTLYEQSAKERQTAINDLFEACVPAPHGRGDETVIDESYRLARELRQNEFALSIDLIGEVGTEILSTISTFSAGRLIHTDKLRAKSVPTLTMMPRLYKLNAYAKNGFFKPHRDTPKGSDHIGTLMIALPVAHRGGALRVNYAGSEVVFNWDQQCSEGLKVQEDGTLKTSLPWAFIFSDVEHEVLPIESGTRITIAYDIFSSETSSQPDTPVDMGPPMTDIAPTTTPLYDEFLAALRNPSFLINGAEVAISLSHSYPKPRQAEQLSNQEFAARLKGVDAIVYDAMVAAGFDVSLKAVMAVETYDYKSEGIPQDGYDPVVSSGESEYGYGTCTEYLITSDTFKFSNWSNLCVEMDGGEDEFRSIVKSEFRVWESPQLMWVKKPKNTFTDAGAYLAYSNEHNIEYFYAAAAFVLYVPPFGEGSRAFS